VKNVENPLVKIWILWARTYTKRLARQIIKLDNDIKSVAAKGVVTTEEIERMLKDAGAELIESSPSAVKRLGIDEISLIKGQGKYCAVLIDLDKSELLALLPMEYRKLPSLGERCCVQKR
jgi:hypothetical protein